MAILSSPTSWLLGDAPFRSQRAIEIFDIKEFLLVIYLFSDVVVICNLSD